MNHKDTHAPHAQGDHEHNSHGPGHGCGHDREHDHGHDHCGERHREARGGHHRTECGNLGHAPRISAEAIRKAQEGEIVCACRNINKEDLLAAIREGGLGTVAEVAEHTGAGVECGECVPAIEALLAQGGR